MAGLARPLDPEARFRMTRPLRRAHFLIWVLMSIVLGLLVSVSLASRRTTTPSNAGLQLGHHH